MSTSATTPTNPRTSEETFRDKITTVDEQGKRVWLYPKKPKGRYYNARTWVSIGLLAILFGGPFIKIGGEPILLLNVLERKFIIFGQVFWPQDFHLFALGVLTMVVFIVLFTVVYGRLFCGWVCPQTIFMEMVFRKIEYAIEGDYTAQKKLDKQPWNQEKIIKKGSKHTIFFTISFLIANTFLAYIIGIEELFQIVTDTPSQHLAGLTAILLFTGAFYFVFASFREQVCTNVCPYGRLHGVLLDRQSEVVAYDYGRGESRGKFRKGEDRQEVGKGDCIDCKQCVYVCPTGIDIRNGTQLECVNCTACMDACDEIMDRINLPRGLVRYASEENIAENRPFHWTKRSIAYSVVLLALLGVLTSLLILRTDVETSILRTPGMLYQDQGDNKISNLYNVKIINKTNEAMPIRLELLDEKGSIQMVGNDELQVKEQDVAEGAFFIIFDRDDVSQMKNAVEVGVYRNDELIETVKTNFLGPNK
ncbi:MAG: cytochrome c oxidase accessory protein CcoG [Cyclobacteriaceae bacterium]